MSKQNQLISLVLIGLVVLIALALLKVNVSIGSGGLHVTQDLIK